MRAPRLRGRARQDGQILMFLLISAITLVSIIALLVNTGSHLNRKVRTQNAVDAVAITQASWTARSLNVMSMNNVALTQSYAVHIIIAALLPTLAELQIKTARKAAEYARAISACLATAAAPPVTAACIAPWAALEIHLGLAVQLPLIEMYADRPDRILDRFTRITYTLEAMNERIATGFPEFAGQVAYDIGVENGLDDAGPRFFALFDGPGSSASTSTTLPVEETSVIDFPLCLTGEKGTTVLIGEFYHNFVEHGYPSGTGPYIIGRDSVNDAVSEPTRALEDVHGVDVKQQFIDNVNKLWRPSCATGIVVTPWNPGRVSVYKLQNPPLGLIALGDQGRQEWSLLALGRIGRDGASVYPKGFSGGADSVYAYAQAEIYNTINYDLYTQAWHAKLVPARLVDDGNLKGIAGAVRDFDELRTLFLNLRDAELDVINVH